MKSRTKRKVDASYSAGFSAGIRDASETLRDLMDEGFEIKTNGLFEFIIRSPGRDRIILTPIIASALLERFR